MGMSLTVIVEPGEIGTPPENIQYCDRSSLPSVDDETTSSAFGIRGGSFVFFLVTTVTAAVVGMV